MKVNVLDTPAIGWLSFALWAVLLFLAEVVSAFRGGWSFERVLTQDQLSYIFVFLHQLVFALAFGSAIAAETESRSFRVVALGFWGVSFAVMLTNALLPLFRSEELAATMSAALVILFFSGGGYLITRRCHLTGFVICGLGLFVWLVPVFVMILSSPSII